MVMPNAAERASKNQQAGKRQRQKDTAKVRLFGHPPHYRFNNEAQDFQFI